MYLSKFMKLSWASWQQRHCQVACISDTKGCPPPATVLVAACLRINWHTQDRNCTHYQAEKTKSNSITFHLFSQNRASSATNMHASGEECLCCQEKNLLTFGSYIPWLSLWSASVWNKKCETALATLFKPFSLFSRSKNLSKPKNIGFVAIWDVSCIHTRRQI